MTRLEPQRWQDLDDHELSRLLATEAQRMPGPRRTADAPRYSIMTIVVRRGWALIGASDARWVAAWLFSNHLVDAYSGELIVITEHGRVDFTTGWGNNDPSLVLN